MDHIWRNADDPDEIFFIFITADLERARKFIDMEHAEVLKENRMQICLKCYFEG
jgi:hypothetical protein